MFSNVNGAPVSEDHYSSTAGVRGPVLLQDVHLIEKLAHFNREVIPERRMHAKGSGAHGTFTLTNSFIQKYSKAALFNQVGKKTDVFVRFSTAASERGSADAERDVRGFAVRFYTDEGNWDLVGNNTPVFYLRDPLKFPDLNHVLKRDPMTNLRNNHAKFDFFAHLPESLHQLTIDYSDRGLPSSFRHMNGFGSHTFSLIDTENQRVWVKFHWVCQQPITNLKDEEAARIVAKDRESFQRDLFEHIAKGNYPRWKLCIQIMTEKQAAESPFNPFDLVKVWSHQQYPLIEVGMMELNRNPDNYFAEVEQVAFSPANLVPGISFSPDRVLQGRLFAYGDAARYRLGVNHWQIPVNMPRCPFSLGVRDGAMRVSTNGMESCPYEPNSNGQHKEARRHKEPVLKLEGDAGHWSHRDDDRDYYSQPRALWRLLGRDERGRLMNRMAADLSEASEDVQERFLFHLGEIAEDYGEGVRKAIAAEKKEERKASLVGEIHKCGNLVDRQKIEESKGGVLEGKKKLDIDTKVPVGLSAEKGADKKHSSHTLPHKKCEAGAHSTHLKK
eukprot:GDKJ01013681.1.p1 GENE.GDKJ01013681.1~~GDKJ01013681.1.p1  ORF type:complete len:557 (+),score=89.57 GDKJ01013681.1:180-1850(+)